MITPFRIGWLVLSLALFSLLGYGVMRPQFSVLITLYGLVFWGYSRIMQPFWNYSKSIPNSLTISQEPDRFLFLAALLFRLTLFFVMPNLSDDYVRFIWDGHLVAHGYNPYLYLPAQLMNTPVAATAGLSNALFEGLNSPRYFTVYPPVNQALFGLAAWLSPHSVQGAVIGLRVPILLAEMGVLWLMVKLLRRFGQDPNLALLYGLNPLVILELTGNLHFEGVMLFFVLLAVWLLAQQHWVGSAGALAVGIGIKLLPLMLLPLLIRYVGWKQGLLYTAVTLFFTALLFLPVLSIELIHNVFSSLNLYFQKFEFNASVYYLIRAMGYWLLGFNIITGAGLFLFVGTVFAVLWIAFREGRFPANRPFANKILFTLTIYWLLATTVHPWYLATLVAVAVFTPFRYPLLWSGVVMLAYAAYRSQPYHENLWIVGVEYAVVISLGLYEWHSVRNQNKALSILP